VSLEGVAQYLREDVMREWAERTLEVLRTEGQSEDVCEMHLISILGLGNGRR
jgi:hypothetical protein